MQTATWSNRIESFAERLNTALGQHQIAFLVAITLLYAISTAGYYQAKTPDPDEVVYLWIVVMPSVHRIWDALVAGINIDPPLTQTLVHWLAGIFGPSVNLARIPETIGFWGLCLGAYVVIRRVAPPLFAAAGLFLPLASTIRSQSIEARPYGVMLGCAMLAVLCWDASGQSERRLKWLAGVTLFIAGALSSHFFGAVVLFPLAIGELAKLLLRRRLDWPACLAIVLGAAPLALWYPILHAGAMVYGKHYFGQVSGDNLYLFFNNVLLLAGFALLLLTACALLASFNRIQIPMPTIEISERARLLLAVAGGFLLIPVLGFAYAVFVSHFFVPKYLMLSVFGVVLGIPLVLSLISGRSLVVGLMLLLAFGGHGLFVFSRGASGFIRAGSEMTLADIEDVAPRTKGDMLVASAVWFENLVNAGGPGSDRLLYLYDPEKAVRYSGTDSSDLVLKALDGQCPARFDNYDHYTSTHRSFYILTAGPVVGVNEWIMKHLAHSSAHLQYIKSAGPFDLYFVTLPEPGQ